MIRFTKIEVKNFMSVGNAPVTIEYNKSKTTLVTATNGVGKSSLLLDSICFVLYGKAYRAVNRPQLINSINQKGTVVECHFAVDKTKYVVKRGLKPNLFEIYKNGKLINQDAASRDYQKVLEQNILKMNYRTFTQVVIMGSGNYIPFMKLTPASRREFIEDVLDIKIFTVMNVLLKQQIKEHQESIDNITRKIDNLNEKLKMQHSFIKTLTDEKQHKIDSLDSAIVSLQKEMDDHWARIELLQLDIDQQKSFCINFEKLSKKLIELKSIQSTVTKNIQKQQENREFYSSTDKCPTCHQQIDESHRKKLVDSVENKIEVLNDGLTDLAAKLNMAQAELTEIKETQTRIDELQSEINQHHSAIRVAQKLIDKHQSELNSLTSASGSIADEQLVLKSMMNEYHKEEAERKKRINDTVYFDAAQVMLRDTGIKTRIVKQYIPIFNKLINQYLHKLDLFVEFTIDENFNEVVKSRYRDTFTYESFSEGERQRIDIALMFTFRDIARLKNAVNCNLLIMDEILDASMDSAGVDNFFNIINGLTGTNLFIISHREGVVDKFEDHIHLIKQGNFTVVDKN